MLFISHFGYLKEFVVFCFVSIFLLFIAACQDEQTNVDCTTYDFSNCNTTEPFYGILKIDLTINGENQKVPIVVYKGKVDDSIVEYVDTLSTSALNIDLPANVYYTVTAKYKSGNKTIIAIDGDDITKKASNICDSTCWSVQNGNINVQLNY